jgi:hypothetical protein
MLQGYCLYQHFAQAANSSEPRAKVNFKFARQANLNHLPRQNETSPPIRLLVSTIILTVTAAIVTDTIQSQNTITLGVIRSS